MRLPVGLSLSFEESIRVVQVVVIYLNLSKGLGGEAIKEQFNKVLRGNSGYENLTVFQTALQDNVVPLEFEK